MTGTQGACFMARALQLAARGTYSCWPNPRVGCVVVRDGEVVGEGFHVRTGGAHAEVAALQMAGRAAEGATVYVTLEPCCHQGRTPPCTNALARAGVRRVVAAMADPNPQVAGRGFAMLRECGIETTCGVLEDSARALNRGFISRHERGRPWVRVKLGMSLDGRSAMASGASQWITGTAARRDVQRLRAASSAILTGSGTVLADDPALTVRREQLVLPEDFQAPSGQPRRVLLDSSFRVSGAAQIFAGAGEVLWVGSVPVPENLPENPRVQAESLPGADGRVDLAAVLARLAELAANEVLVEAGATLAGAFVKAGLADELVFYLAPSLLGDTARAALNLPGLERLDQRVRLKIHEVRQVGDDIRVCALPVED